MSAFLLVNVIVPYVYAISYLGLGLLAMKRSPWLATLGIIAGWVGNVPWGYVADQSYMLNAMAHLGNDTVLPTIETVYFSNGIIFLVAAGWVLGHLLGYVLLGVTLWRAQAVPEWAASLIVISAPLMGPIAYGTGIGALQVLGYMLVFIGSIPAALAILKTRSESIS